MENKLPENFLSQYLQYVGETECPIIHHRWCALVGVGALLERNFHIQHGHFEVNPNIYAMIVGAAGTRKSTSIKLMKKLIQEVGYDTIAADRTTKEKFLLDISGEGDESFLPKGKDILDENLWGDGDAEINTRPAAQCFIMADEWNDFTSLGNLEFYSLLGTFWDFSGVYKNRIKTGKSVSINNPTISILAGNTPTGFSLAFPAEAIGQGFFSRLVLVHGENSGKLIAFPKKPDALVRAEIVDYLRHMRSTCQGIAPITHIAEKLLEKIYKNFRGFEDARFESYFNRRFTHLLKLCLACAASRLSNKIEEEDIILANTILTHTEHSMSKSLGEFGKGKHSDVANKLVDILSNSDTGLNYNQLYSLVVQDLDKTAQLGDILNSLKTAGRIQQVGSLLLVKRKILVEISNDTVDYNLLTDEERGRT